MATAILVGLRLQAMATIKADASGGYATLVALIFDVVSVAAIIKVAWFS